MPERPHPDLNRVRDALSDRKDNPPAEPEKPADREQPPAEDEDDGDT
jgi:hypothetical protein